MIFMRNLIVFMIAVLLFSCSGGNGKSVAINDISIIDGFPSEVSLEEIDFNCDEIGLNSIKVVDSLLVVGHDAHWSILNSRDGKKYDDCLGVGQGPGEFNVLPRSASSLFISEGDSLVAYIPDKNKGRIMRFNLSGFLGGMKEPISVVLESDILNNNCWEAIPCGPSSFLVSVANDSFTGFRRRILHDGVEVDHVMFSTMDTVCVNGEEDINLLAKVTRYNPSSDRFVEGMLYLNQLNIYSADGKWGKTVCVGKELDNLADVESTMKAMRKNAYISMSAFDEGFGAIYSGFSDTDIYTGKGTGSEIQFFDWDGNPVCWTRLPYPVLAFDVDIPGGRIYAIDEKEDRLRVYDAKKISRLYGQKQSR